MIIHSHTKEYEVQFKKDFSFLEELLRQKDCFVVLDEEVYDKYREMFGGLNDALMLLRAREENKVVDTALEICERMSSLQLKRNATLISIGGGIVQDVTGFAANILFRGVRWIFVPTTLLAACDSCIGGKTSLNYKHFKNLLGTFFAPDSIYICSAFFDTLSQRDYESGLGEVVKFNIMAGEDGLEFLDKNINKLLARDKEMLDLVIERSLGFKKRFIEIDEFDRGERVKLNFAHTFGHAFETMSNYQIPHGTAVAMGSIAANSVSVSRGWLEPAVAERMEGLLLQIIHVDAQHIAVDIDEILKAMHKDKKQIGSSITTVLMKGTDLELCIVHDTAEDEIRRAVEHLFALLRTKNQSL